MAPSGVTLTATMSMLMVVPATLRKRGAGSGGAALGSDDCRSGISALGVGTGALVRAGEGEARRGAAASAVAACVVPEASGDAGTAGLSGTAEDDPQPARKAAPIRRTTAAVSARSHALAGRGRSVRGSRGPFTVVVLFMSLRPWSGFGLH